MNKKKIIIIIAALICMLLVGCLYFWILPSRFENQCKNRVYPELKDRVEEAKKSVVGIIPENQEKDGISHNGIGSGVIFDKIGNTYYVVTAAHVVEGNNNLYKIFTINTKFSGETINIDDNVDILIPDEKYYDSLLTAKIEYLSNNADLAIVSFESEDEFPIMKFETSKLKKGQRIVAIGHPGGKRYYTSYGTITSGVKSITMVTKSTGKRGTDKIIEHNAYLNFGNSGGPIISENMKIAGINIGGKFNLLGYFKKGFMIPFDIIQDNINEWRSK